MIAVSGAAKPAGRSNAASSFGLEPCRPLSGHAKCSLEREPDLPDQTVVEQPAEDRDSVRHAPRRSELRQRYGRVRGPVTARFRDGEEPGAERERWMTGEVRDGELLVA